MEEGLEGLEGLGLRSSEQITWRLRSFDPPISGERKTKTKSSESATFSSRSSVNYYKYEDCNTTMVTAHKVAADIADKWGPALTKSIKERDISDFKALFASDEPVFVVLQNAEGNEAEFTIGDIDEASLTWDEYHELSIKDLTAQQYAKTEAQCLGVLGDRMILESDRFNTDGDVYMEAFSLLTLNEEGKIVAFEAFSDPQSAQLLASVSK